MAVDVAQGGLIRAIKVWKNTGDAAGTRDVIAAYGVGATWEAFVTSFFNLIQDVPISAGQQLTTPVDCNIPVDAPLGLLSAVVGVGDWDPDTGYGTFDAWEIVPNAINITAIVVPEVVPVEISVTFQKVG